jgi:hypothetical protein
MYGQTPDLIPGLTPEEFTEIVRSVGWERVREALGVADSTLERWMAGVGMPMPRNQQAIKIFVGRIRYQHATGSVERRRRVRQHHLG